MIEQIHKTFTDLLIHGNTNNIITDQFFLKVKVSFHIRTELGVTTTTLSHHNLHSVCTNKILEDKPLIKYPIISKIKGNNKGCYHSSFNRLTSLIYNTYLRYLSQTLEVRIRFDHTVLRLLLISIM